MIPSAVFVQVVALQKKFHSPVNFWEMLVVCQRHPHMFCRTPKNMAKPLQIPGRLFFCVCFRSVTTRRQKLFQHALSFPRINKKTGLKVILRSLMYSLNVQGQRNIGVHRFEPFNFSLRPSNAKVLNKSKQGEWDTAHLAKWRCNETHKFVMTELSEFSSLHCTDIQKSGQKFMLVRCAHCKLLEQSIRSMCDQQ